MIILAATIVISLNNSGIISKANDAVDKTDLANVQDLATMLWADAYLDAKLEGNITEEGLEAAVITGLNEADVDITKYIIDVTEAGVIVTKAGPWKLQKTVTDGKVTAVTVTNGTLTLDVGTTVNYMPSGVGPIGAQYTGGWKILGVDDNGRLLIMSNESITESTVTLGGTSLSEATTSYLNALTTLQDTAKDYKDGTIGVEVRSVKVEDIDALTSFDKTTHADENLYAYGIEVTYTWKEVAEGEEADYKPVYSYVHNGETKSGQLSNAHSSGFTYYDKETGKITTVPYSNGGTITTLKCNWYYYPGAGYLADTTPAYKMIFGNADGSGNIDRYWLATPWCGMNDEYVAYGMSAVNECSVTGGNVFLSYGYVRTPSCGVRAVVTLASDIRLTEGTTAGTYDLTLTE